MRPLRALAIPALALAAAGCGGSSPLSELPRLGDLGAEGVPDALAVAGVVDGFGGYFLDGEGRPAAYLTDPALRPAAAAALAGFLRSRGFTAGDLRIRQGRYDYRQLDAWHRLAYPQVLSLPGAVFSDLDEAAHVVRFGLASDAAVALAANLVAQLGLPADAVVVERAEPIVEEQARAPRVSLQDGRARPVAGGYQLNFFFDLPVKPVSSLCTLGFNAVQDGERSLVTNSHCSNLEGRQGVADTRYFQPSIDAAGENEIALEAEDPSGETIATNAECPAGFTCRYSDASRAVYLDSVPSQLGGVARTVSRGEAEGSLIVDPARPLFRIVGKQLASVAGERVNKVGRTTGWTHGIVERTCFNVVGTGGTNPFMRLCQTDGSYGSNSGDSGSPVFALAQGLDGDEVVLLGIHWGSGGTFSPLAGIEHDLGELTVHD